MRKNVSDFIVSPTTSVRDVMSVIDRNALGIAVVVDDQTRLQGTITDGDLRRAILRGVELDAECGPLMSRSPRAVTTSTPEPEVLKLMKSTQLRQIPVLGDDDELLGLHLFSDLATTSRVPAVIMAGGLGSRLGDLTNKTPKPLIEVGGKPILEHIVEHLGKSGVSDVFITTRYLAEQIEEHFEDGESWGLAIRYVREKQRLGTAGALKYLEGQIERPFLVMNGDLLTDFNVEEFEHFHAEAGAHMTVAVRHYSFQVPFGVVELDAETAMVAQLSEKPTYDFFVNAGIYMLDPDVLKYVPREEYYDITQLIEAVLADGGQIASFPVMEQWLDIGRPEDLERADTIANGE